MQDEAYSEEQRDSRRLVKTNERGIYKRGNRYVVRYRDRQGREKRLLPCTELPF